MKIKVCDALCGSGKTSACIRMMNERTDKNFIFVTQYLTEVDRIKDKCRRRHFISPENDLDHKKTKLSDIHKLIKAGNNIATTHSLFVSYTEETKRMIREQNYILVLDETVDVMSMADVETCDLNILRESKSLVEEDGELKWLNDSYGSNGRGRFVEEMQKAKSKNLLKYDDDYFFWAIPPELFTCFDEVYVLTYLFQAQTLRCFFDLYGLDYEYIGVKFTDKNYVFCPFEQMNRKVELRNKIHILDTPKINSIGDDRTALSYSWYRVRANKATETNSPDFERLRKNLGNYYRNYCKASKDEIMWTTFKSYREQLAGRGYSSSFVTYNKRASNEYCNRKYLAYCVNNFPRPWEARYFHDRNVKVNGDEYALSILVQWIFRSAIRIGSEINVYIPSARMRSLLIQWLDKLAEGKDLEPIHYVGTRARYSKKEDENE